MRTGSVADDIAYRLVVDLVNDLVDEDDEPVATKENVTVHRVLDGPMADKTLPDDVFGIYLFEIPDATEETMGDNVAFENWGVQVQVRHNSLQLAEKWANQVWTHLPTVGEEINIPKGFDKATGYNRIWRMCPPVLMQQEDPKGRFRFYCEFGVKRRPQGKTAQEV